MSTTTALVTLAVAALVAVFGVLIREYEMVELIAGYDPEVVTDDEGLAAFVGTNMLYVAGLTAVVGLVVSVEPFEDDSVLWLGYTLAVVVVAAWTVLGAQRYQAS
jgi:hypothetical protein